MSVGYQYHTRGGHFTIVKWAFENGCRWDDYTAPVAALKGRFEILKWLREQGECVVVMLVIF